MAGQVCAQGILEKKISLRVVGKPVSEVLSAIEQEGNFRFSYNSNVIRSDSLVTLTSVDQSIGETLDLLFGGKTEYREAGRFVILRYTPNQLNFILDNSGGTQEQYQVSGRIIDVVTGKPVAQASIYEKHLLQTTISNPQGYFTIRLKNISPTIALTISKESYRDLTTLLLPEIVVRPGQRTSRTASGDYYAGDVAEVERTRLGRIFVTSSQKIQSLNIGGFIADSPVQASLSPGLSSRGSLSGQVINKFSFNVTGGYSGGVNGAEIGFLFNINKRDVGYFQFGGAFNVTGGSVRGLQIGGLYNQVLDSVKGTQISLGYNRVRKTVNGIQLGGVLNLVEENFSGVQLSLGYNRIKQNFNGLQIGALYNNVKQHFGGTQLSLLFNQNQGNMRGVQAALVNYSRHVKGLQVGLINVADTSSGYSLGLLNLIRKGKHFISISTNESINTNLAIKTGNKNMYTMLLGGMNTGSSNKLYALGLGLGKEYPLNQKWVINPELSSRFLYQGAWPDNNLLNRLDLTVGYLPAKWLAISVGPAWSVLHTNQKVKRPGYAFIQRNRGDLFNNEKWKSWMGWNLGVSLRL